MAKVDTSLQNADYLTKGLSREVFQANRHRVQGWQALAPATASRRVSFAMDKQQYERESQDSSVTELISVPHDQDLLRAEKAHGCDPTHIFDDAGTDFAHTKTVPETRDSLINSSSTSMVPDEKIPTHNGIVALHASKVDNLGAMHVGESVGARPTSGTTKT